MANPKSEIRSNGATSDARVARVDMKFEIVVIPVSDVDRAKEFYGRLGWRLDADYAHGEHEKRTGGQRDENWPDWYAEYMRREQAGEEPPQ